MNPTEEPSSTLLHQVEKPLEVEAGDWQRIVVDLRPEDLTVDGQRGNMTTMYVRLGPPHRGTSFLDIDDLRFIEWRPADQQPDEWGAFTHARNRGGSIVRVGVPLLPWASE